MTSRRCWAPSSRCCSSKSAVTSSLSFRALSSARTSRSLLILELRLESGELVLLVRDLHGQLGVRLREGVDVGQPIGEVRHVLGVQQEVDARGGPGHVRGNGTIVEAGRDPFVAGPSAIELLLRPVELGRHLFDRDLSPLDLRRRRRSVGPASRRAGPGCSLSRSSIRSSRALARSTSSLEGAAPATVLTTDTMASSAATTATRVDLGKRRAVSVMDERLRPEGRWTDRPEQTAKPPVPLQPSSHERNATAARAQGSGRVQVFDQLHGVAVRVVERRESSDPGHLRLLPVEDHPSLLQRPSGLVQIRDPEDDRPARRHRGVLGPVQGEPDRTGLELRPFVARTARDRETEHAS